MRKIYTYYQPIRGEKNSTNLLAVWKMSWRSKCWQPIVLDESHAVKHADFDDLDRALPTTNSKQYERTCNLRYVAMVTVGGGVTVDNDVMNMEFWPTDVPDPLPERLQVSSVPDTPALMYAPGEEYDRVIRLMANCTLTPDDVFNTRPHTSDMFIMVKLLDRKEVDRIPVDPLWIHEGLGQKLFHLSNQQTTFAQRHSGINHLDKGRLAIANRQPC